MSGFGVKKPKLQLTKYGPKTSRSLDDELFKWPNVSEKLGLQVVGLDSKQGADRFSGETVVDSSACSGFRAILAIRLLRRRPNKKVDVTTKNETQGCQEI